MQTVNLFGYACGIGGSNPGNSFGPIYFQGHALAQLSFPHLWHDMLYCKQNASKLAALEPIAEICSRLALLTFESVTENSPFVAIGGDQSCSIGCHSGAAEAVRAKGDYGLLWIDAHLSSHTFATTETGNIHGMALAALLGHGETPLTSIISNQPKVKPENVCLIGARSFERGEQELLERIGVKIYYAEEIHQHGIDQIFAEALALVTQHTAAFGVSLNLNALEPADAPGVATPEPNGIAAKPLIQLFRKLHQHPQFIGMNIVEFNPNLDVNQKTLQVMIDSLNMIFAD